MELHRRLPARGLREVLEQDAQKEVRPNLFMVGAAKCGTSAWYVYLRTHPDICFSPVKEPMHFSTDHSPHGRIADRNEYMSLFKKCGAAKVIGEASTPYLFSEVAANNIRCFNPDAKIIIFVRNQEDFLASRHNHMMFSGKENIADFEQAWNLSGKRDKSNMSPYAERPRGLDYRAAGEFSPQVERYFAQFPADQIRVFHFNDWTRNPRETYLEIMRFLGLKDDGRTTFERVNEAKHRKGKLVVRLIRKPPWPALPLADLFGVSGRFRQSVRKWVSRLDTWRGSRTKLDERLKQDIRAFYEADNERLRPRVWTGRQYADEPEAAAPHDASAA